MPDTTRLRAPDPAPDHHSGATLDEMLTVAEVAVWLKVSRSWIYDRTRSHGPERLPHIKLGKYVRFSPDAVRAFLDRRAHGR